jgi:hypothetical protein
MLEEMWYMVGIQATHILLDHMVNLLQQMNVVTFAGAQIIIEDFGGTIVGKRFRNLIS